ncbi:efflux RND transporter periplasmic adaptor subunit [Vibrio nomapromontoriensis]|uniref:efflux RND transporter periplasmic adaptor subunit n=1 Tax=Vibrio nomapromontoriensis TaxID=2910246 RepID=UPI003D0B46FD
MSTFKPAIVVAVISSCLLITGCQKDAQANEPAKLVFPPANISVISAKSSAVILSDEFQGRVRAIRSAEIRPQVSGIITERLFTQGQFVEKGAPLFKIDDRSYKLEVQNKKADLEKATVQLQRLEKKAKRYKTLVQSSSISQDKYDDVLFNKRAAQAEAHKANALLGLSNLNLEYTTINAPISGVIGEVKITEGALVGPQGESELALITQLNEVYVDIRLPSSRLASLLAMKQSQENTTKEEGVSYVNIYSSFDPTHPIKGRILFSGVNVDEGTGDVIVRAKAKNDKRLLLAGMYTRVKLAYASIVAFSVPQQAVLHSPDGKAYVVVLENGKTRKVNVTIKESDKGSYIITGSLQDGEKIVVQGQDKIQVGVELNPIPWTAK